MLEGDCWCWSSICGLFAWEYSYWGNLQIWKFDKAEAATAYSVSFQSHKNIITNEYGTNWPAYISNKSEFTMWGVTKVLWKRYWPLHTWGIWIQIYHFVDQLLSNESSRAIISTYVNLFHSKMIKDNNPPDERILGGLSKATQLRVWEYTAGNFNKGTASRCHRQWLAFLHQQHWSGEELPFSLWLWRVQDIIQELGIGFYCSCWYFW